MAKQSLVIVESPAKAKTIGKYLGKDYEVKACMGHLRDLQKSKLSVDVDNDFEPVYKPIKGKEAIISDLKKSAKAADTVYLATDPDREGEAISWHLKYLLDLNDQKARRVTFNEITKNVVQESIARPREIDQNLVDAQQARRFRQRLRAGGLRGARAQHGLAQVHVQGAAPLPPPRQLHGRAAAHPVRGTQRLAAAGSQTRAPPVHKPQRRARAQARQRA